MTPTLETLFGGRTAAQVLMFIQAYNEGHANRIATTYEVPVSQVQTQLQKLEANGVLVSRMVGRTRLFTWNPRNLTVQDLQKFLDAELHRLPRDIIKRYYRQRQRPRRTREVLTAS